MHQGQPSDSVSVILPFHNRWDTLAMAVRSVLTQTHVDLLLYLIDDGSTDSPTDIAEQFNDPRLRYVRLNPNQGVAHARNIGLRETSTRLVAFMDSDDLWLPMKIDVQLQHLREAQRSDSGIAVVGCAWRMVGQDAPARRFAPGPFSQSDVHDRVAGLGTPMLLVDRSVADPEARFDESLPALLDRDYVISCLANGTSVIVVPQVLAEVRRGRSDHVASSSRTATAFEIMMHKYADHLTASPELKSWYSFRAAREHLISRDIRAAFRHIKTALRHHPLRRIIELFLGLVAGRKGLSLAHKILPELPDAR